MTRKNSTKTNGNGKHEDAITAKAGAQIETLKGDIRDEILREFKAMAKPWAKMTETEQERVIHRAGDISGKLVMQACNAIASRGFKYFDVTLGKITVDKGIECKFTLPYSADGIAGLCQRKGDSVMLVARDAAAFFGEKKKAETDVVGDLAIPKDKEARRQTPPGYDPETGEELAA